MKESFQRIILWVKTHPWLAALIIGGVLLLGYLAYRRSVSSGEGSTLQATAPDASAAGGAAGEPLPAATPLQEPTMIPGAEISPLNLPAFGGFDFGGGGGGKTKVPMSAFTTTPVMPIAADTTVSPTSDIGAGETLLQASAAQFYSGAQLDSILNTPAGQVPVNMATGQPLNIFTGNLQYNTAEVLPKKITATGPIPTKTPPVPAPTMTQQTNPFIGNYGSPSLGNTGQATKPAPKSPKPTPGASGPATVQAGSLLASMGATVGSAAANPFTGSAAVKSSSGSGKNAMPTKTTKPAPINTKSQDRKVDRMK